MTIELDRALSVSLSPDAVVVREGDRLVVLGASVPTVLPSAAVLSAILETVGSGASVGDLATRVAERLRCPEPHAMSLIGDLDGSLLRVHPADRSTTGHVVVVGSGALAERLASSLASREMEVRTVVPLTFASCQDPRFTDRLVVGRQPPGESEVAESGVGVDQLAALFEGADAIVCALEEVHLRALLDVESAALRHGVPCLFVVPGVNGVDVGPTLTDAETAGPACARLIVDWQGTGADLVEHAWVPPLTNRETVVELAVTTVTDEVARLQGEAVRRGLVDRMRRFRSTDGSAGVVAASEHPLERVVAPQGAIGTSVEGRLARLHEQFPTVPVVAAGPRPEKRSVGILGGGTAGWLAALTLRRLRPEIDVTVIESSQIPVIGVGEATTSELPPFLHRVLGLDVEALYDEVRPTWKLGIRFEWGERDRYFFPFDFGRPLEATLYDDPDSVTIESMLMAAERGLLLREPSGRIRSLLHSFPYAYHLDNAPFVAFLRRQAVGRGVRHMDRLIEHVERSVEGSRPTVTALVDDRGERHRFDYYVDCSGFRSTLLEATLDSPFISYRSSLFTDTALVAERPHGGSIKPHTTATTMDAGWCWTIPTMDEDHLGYVHSSTFIDIDRAADEMARRHPGLGEQREVRFRSGRHRDFMLGNVIAIGNSYGFVEPLESTAIQLILWECLLLAKHLPERDDDTHTAALLSREVAGVWDYLRGFLATHYRFNRRLDTPFWTACRSDVDLAGAAETVEMWQEGAPLVYRSFGRVTGRHLGGAVFSNFAFDTHLFGQGVPHSELAAREPPERYRRRAEAVRELVDLALPQAECLALLTGPRRDLLRDQVMSPDGWMASVEGFLQDVQWVPGGAVHT